MTIQPPPEDDRSRSIAPSRGSKSPVSSSRPDATLSYQGSYLCPICRHGQITGLTLMDAFACSFCRHIFTANVQQQTVQVVDSSQPLTWRWNGRNWQSTHQDDPSLTAVLWLIGVVLVTLPASIVWLMSYLFPPLPGSVWSWFPGIWIGCTLGVHLLMVGWLLAEHYQLPLYVASRVRLRQWLGRR